MRISSDPQPEQYQKGWTEFYKLKFKVTPDVLIPRPESELLVDEVIALAKQSNHPNVPITILDLGTGSGCIAISIAKNLPEAKIIATDISEKALKVASFNAKSQKVSGRIVFVMRDLLEGLNYSNIDIIVANLPYIPTERIPYLDSSVKDFEPKIALDGGKDGFEFYRKLFAQISQQPRGLLAKVTICEIDYTHGELAVNETLKFFPNASVEVKHDLSKKQRILVIKF